VSGAVDALSKRPLQVLGAYRLEHVVPQSNSGTVMSFAREMEAIGSEVGAIGATVGKQRNIGVDHERLINYSPVVTSSVPEPKKVKPLNLHGILVVFGAVGAYLALSARATVNRWYLVEMLLETPSNKYLRCARPPRTVQQLH
jgi:hypothetical protein